MGTTAIEPTCARPDREQTKSMFRARIIQVMARAFAKATPDTVSALTADMFTLIERHGWSFSTRSEREAAAERDGCVGASTREDGSRVFAFADGTNVVIAPSQPRGTEAVVLARMLVDLQPTSAELQRQNDQLRLENKTLREQAASRVKRVERNAQGQITKVIEEPASRR